MRGLSETGPVELANALMAWWSLAGVDCAVADAPVNWLRPTPSPNQRPAHVPGSEPAAAKPRLPETLEAFHAYLADASDLPEARWAMQRVAPVGEAGAELMVISDFPDSEDMGRDMLLSGEPGQLFDAMLRAIGLDRSRIYLASLAMAKPLGGMGEDETQQLVERMRVQITLARPKRVLLLGDRTNRALMAADSPVPSLGLAYLNHGAATVPAAAVLHPRLMLSHGETKRDCWRTLQNLVRDHR